MEIIVAIISPFVALISGTILWYFNERGKRAYQTYLAKLKLYENMILSIDTFVQGSEDINRRQAFNNNLNLAWMYCSEEVIEKADAFLETTRVGASSNDNTRRESLNSLMRAIRKDMKLKSPSVTFKIWIAS